MKNFKNEQGYALLVVILIVVLIMGLFTSFMSVSISNAKQEQLVDDKNLTVAAAEMGVDYYISHLKNLYYSHTSTMEQIVLGELANPNNNINFEKVQSDVVKNLKDLITNYGTNNFTNKTIPIINDFTFELKEPLHIEIRENNVIVAGVVLGKNTDSGNERKLDFIQTIHVPDFASVSSINRGINLPEIEERFFQGYIPTTECSTNDITQEFNGKQCSYLSGNLHVHKLKMNNSSLYTKEDLNVKNDYFQLDDNSMVTVNNNLDIQKLSVNNSKLFVGNDLEVKNEINVGNASEIYVKSNVQSDKFHIDDSKLFVGGIMTLKNDVNLTNSSVFINRSLESDKKDGINNIKLINSKLYVGGNLDSKNNTEIDSNSLLYVNGDLNLKNNTTIKENSKVCVVGNLTHKNNFTLQPGSAVYVKGTSTASGITNVNSIEELEYHCSITNEFTLNDVTWPVPEIDVTY